jgi:GNAT superfamily N-acetyltransferase
MSRRLRLRFDLATLPAAHHGSIVDRDPSVRRVRSEDQRQLADLLLDAYRGTVDDEGEGPEEAAAEVARLLGGAYGAFDAAASEVVELGGAIVAATLVTEFEGRPLIAFSLVHPSWRRRGLGRAGLVRTLDRLRSAGWSEVRLAVTETNLPARSLYEQVGFRPA